MRLRNAVFLGMCLAALGTLGCVAGQESFRMGEALSEKQRWEEAAVFYEKAVKENPGKEDYAAALKKAKQEAAKAQYAKTQELLKANPEANIPTLNQILKQAEAAYALDPGNPEIAALKNALQQKTSRLLDETRLLNEQADQALKERNWTEAIAKLTRITGIYPGYEDTGDKLATARGEATKVFYKQGLEFAKQEEWKMAAQAFKNVLDIQPDYLDTKALYENAQANDSIHYFLGKGREAVAAKQWDRAVVLYTKALDYQPDNQDIQKAIKTLKGNAAVEYLTQAEKATSENRLNDGVIACTKALGYDPSLAESQTAKELIENLSRKLWSRAEDHLSKEKWGNGLVWLQKLSAINPNYPNLFRKTQSVRDEIEKRIKKSIAVFDFSSPSNNADAGKIVANKLITFLYEKASGDLRIIERENLQSILKELQLGQTGLIDMETAQKVGKMRGINTFILGDVLQYSSSVKDFPSNKTVMIKVGSRRVKTKAFLEWEAKHPNPSRDELQKAPLAYEEEDVFERFSYRAGTTKIMTFLEVAYKMVDTLTGENLFTNTISGKLEKEDSYNDGVPAGANIPYDPLELPSELEVLNELTNSKVTEIGLGILKHFQSLELVYYNEAEQLVRRREYEKAIEKYTDAVFDEKLKRISSPISIKSLETIEELIKTL
jgi:tetratricopeptide (TPR) repeat protein